MTSILDESKMAKRKEEQSKYFAEALGDFVHEAASGGAIRHLLELGYTTDGILKKLDFPTPRSRIEKTVYQYLTEKGILMEELPQMDFMEKISLDKQSEVQLYKTLRTFIDMDGEENAYVSCPFGTIRRDREARLQAMLGCLTSREREYLMGIPWQQRVMYHRLNSRMLEIAVCLTINSEVDLNFIF